VDNLVDNTVDNPVDNPVQKMWSSCAEDVEFLWRSTPCPSTPSPPVRGHEAIFRYFFATV